MSDEWYCSRKGKQVGPFSLTQVKQFITTGKLKRTSLVWTQALGDWIPAEQVAELYPPVAAPPPVSARTTPPPVVHPTTVSSEPMPASTDNPESAGNPTTSADIAKGVFAVVGGFLLCVFMCCGFFGLGARI